MKARMLAIVGVVCALGATGPVTASAQDYGDDYYDDGYYDDDYYDVDAGGDVVDFFRAALDPYGTWFNYGSYGMVWRPRNVGRDWRPYRDGHWILTDAGWTWVSDEPWGSGPYHYGRWFHDADYGWPVSSPHRAKPDESTPQLATLGRALGARRMASGAPSRPAAGVGIVSPDRGPSASAPASCLPAGPAER